MNSLALPPSEPQRTFMMYGAVLKYQDLQAPQRSQEYMVLWLDGSLSFFRRARRCLVYIECCVFHRSTTCFLDLLGSHFGVDAGV